MHPSRITECAREWIGTRYHHQGRLKKTAQHRGGCDCLGLLVGVASELKLESGLGQIADFDSTEYGHLPDCDALYHHLRMHLALVSSNDMREGDVALFSIDGRAQHLGLISRLRDSIQGLGIIHAYAPSRSVVEHRLDEAWQRKLEATFRIPGLSADRVV